MKKIIAFIFLSMIGLSSFAQNLNCDMRGSIGQVNQCYAGQMRLANLELDQFVKEVYNHKKLSQKFKTRFEAEHGLWVEETNETCQTNQCLYMQVIYRRNKVGTILNDLDAGKKVE
jgi:uncharacterized protein